MHFHFIEVKRITLFNIIGVIELGEFAKPISVLDHKLRLNLLYVVAYFSV
jgi:hypothetical protein